MSEAGDLILLYFGSHLSCDENCASRQPERADAEELAQRLSEMVTAKMLDKVGKLAKVQYTDKYWVDRDDVLDTVAGGLYEGP
jgi:hypothetical protein